MSPFSGTGTAIITPMNKDQSVDFPGLERVVEHNINGGGEYIVVLGTTGESATLNEEQKDRVIRTVMETASGRVPVVIGCGGNHTRAVCEQIRKYTETYQPDAFLYVSPYYNKPTQDGIIAHFSAVANSTERPIILYNVPGRTSSNLLPTTVVHLARSYKNVVAIKEASGDLDDAQG